MTDHHADQPTDGRAAIERAPVTHVLGRVRYTSGPLSADAPAERARVWAEGAKIHD